jgi:hypothetical protein
VRILGVIRSGAYVEVHGGMIGAEPQGRDLEHIAAWRALRPVIGGWRRVLVLVRDSFVMTSVLSVFVLTVTSFAAPVSSSATTAIGTSACVGCSLLTDEQLARHRPPQTLPTTEVIEL